jgi:precorrin-6B methylase 2
MGKLTTAGVQCVRKTVANWPQEPDASDLNELLRLLGFWRQQMLANTYLVHHGPRVLAGPFAGMEYVGKATEGALLPRLLGTYEAELHPHLEAFRQEGVDCVIDVGCAEGFYAVGLARLMPGALVYAYDVDPKAREACAELAARNGVGDRLVIRELFRPHDFQSFANRHALVIMDVEGAETELLRPDLAPALAGMRLIVETHGPAQLSTVRERFLATHEIEQVDIGPKMLNLPSWLQELGHLDQLLAVWEWRGIPTPWLVMRPRTA